MEEVKPKPSSADRVRRHRDNVLRAGGRRMTVTLNPEAAAALDHLLTAGYSGSAVGIINRALTDAARARGKR